MMDSRGAISSGKTRVLERDSEIDAHGCDHFRGRLTQCIEYEMLCLS